MALTAEQIRASLEAKKKLLSGGAPNPRDELGTAPPSQNNLPAPAPSESVRTGEAREGDTKRHSLEDKGPLTEDSRGGQKLLSGGVEKSHETHWQTGKDSPEAIESQDSSPMRKVSGSEVSRSQGSGSSAPPAQKAPRGKKPEVPQAPEIELAVLAALYQYPATCFPIFNERARPEFFFSPINRSFFERLSDYFSQHGQADPQSFLQFLLDSNQLEKHGGTAFLSSLLTAASPPSALEYHLDILRDKFVAREAFRLSQALSSSITAASESELWSLISEHEEAISSLRALATDTMEGVENFSYSDLVGFDSAQDDSVLLGARRWLGKGYTCLWAGGSGYGKSTLEMQAALYWATGTPLFGIKPVRPLKSLILQAENDLGDTGEQLQGVIAGISATGDISLNGEVERMIIVNRLIGCTGDTFLARLSALLKIHRPDLVWIDPLFAFAGCDLIDTEAVSNFLRNGLIPIVVEAQVCAHVIHHVSKPARDNDQKKDWSTFDYQYLGFGSSEIQNAFRAVNIILPVSNDPGTFHLILSKRGDRAGATDLNRESTRDIYLAHGKEGSILWTQVEPPDSEGGKGAHRPKAFKLTDLLGEMSVTDPLKTSALCKHACVETGMSRATFYRLFDEAKNAQKIKVNDEGWTLS